MQSGRAAQLTSIAEELQALQWVIASLTTDPRLVLTVGSPPAAVVVLAVP